MIKQTLCFSSPTHLSLHLGQLVIDIAATATMPERHLTRPIEDIAIVILESRAITLTTALLDALLQNNVAVISCDSLHLPSGLFLPLESNVIQSERFKAQISSTLPLRKRLWQQTVSAKIYNQWRVMRRWSMEECECMSVWSGDVKSDDTTNLEARAAAFYWKNIFKTKQTFRRRRFAEDENILLNYGYSILRATIARALVGSGLLPTLGIHHRNRYNAYCLADDIMEPYRPYVDHLVLSIINQLQDEIALTTDIKRQLLSIPVIDVKIDGFKRPLMIAASITSASLVSCFEGKTRTIKYPFMD